MADKTYKFVSVCERPMPVQTNNAYQFTWHVAFCKTCLEKLPEGILKQLEPKLSQFISERAKKKLPPEQKPPVETIASTADAEKVKKGMKPGIVVEDSRINGSKIIPQSPPISSPPKADKEQQSQFDTLIKDSPVFQGLTKSMEGLEGKLTGRINALGDMMQTRMEQVFKGISAERGVEKTEEEPPPDQTPPPDTPPETGATGGNVDRSGRSGAFGQSDQLPAAMRDGYRAGDKPPPQVPPLDIPPGIEQPPPSIEQPPPGIEQPPPSDLTGKGMPRLQTPEEVELFKRFLAEEEARLAGGGKVPVKKADNIIDSARGGVGLLKEVVDIFRGGGQNQPSALAGTPIGEMLSMVKGVNDLTMGNFKGMFEMIKAVREAEKLIWTEPPAPPSSSIPHPSPGREEPPPKENIT